MACLALLAATPALAHPHVWVTARAELVYGSDGMIVAVRHHWTFDEAYSSFAVEGLDANHDGKVTPDELADLAKTNTDSLAEFAYFTMVKANGVKQAFGEPRAQRMVYENGQLTLNFELPLKMPTRTGKLVVFEVYDPTFFVDFQTAEGEALRLDGAPKGCAITLTRPKPLPVAGDKTLSEEFFQTLNAGSAFGAQFSSRAIVACP